MIQNPAIQGGSGSKKYKVTSDVYNKFYPEEAEPGEYVATVTGGIVGNPFIYTGPDRTGYLVALPVSERSIDLLPPEVKKIIEKYPVTYAPPATISGYLFFAMPATDVFVYTDN